MVLGVRDATQWIASMELFNSLLSVAVGEPFSISDFLGTRWFTRQVASRRRASTTSVTPATVSVRCERVHVARAVP